MKMYFYRGEQPNFGDELNAWLWPRIFGQIFDEDDSEIFLGVGSILYDGAFPKRSRKIVFGAGYARYTPAPDVHDNRWKVYFVRGPRTAAALHLDASTAITDPAALIRTQRIPTSSKTSEVSFMPHWQSMDRGRWGEVCRLAGIRLIDPRRPVDEVLSEIAASKRLISEAMHGAIAADSLRIPWVGLTPVDPAHRLKWFDWTDSLRIAYVPRAPIVSTLGETWTKATGRGWLGRWVGSIARSKLVATVEEPLVHLAAKRLCELAQGEFSLSRESELASACDRIEHQVQRFKRDLEKAHTLRAKAVRPVIS